MGRQKVMAYSKEITETNENYIPCENCNKMCSSMGCSLRYQTYHKWDERALCYDCMMKLYGDKIRERNNFFNIPPPVHYNCKTNSEL